MTSKKSNLSVNFVQGNTVGENMEKRKFFAKEHMQKIKATAGHVGLLITLMFYTAIGGLVFRHIELPAELARLEALRANLRAQRYSFMDSVSNNTDVTNLRTLVSVKLRAYEKAAQEAAQGGLLISFVTDMIDQEDRATADLPPIVTERWSVLQAVFFASTVLTTIGYGNLVPSTNGGRMFCMLFAFVGIPLTLIVIADWGKLFAGAVVKIALVVKSKLPLDFSFPCIPSNSAGRRSLGAIAAILLLFLYLACGAGMFMLWEDDWNFFDGFYFCFVTMTTIGFGDLVPKKPKYTLLCTLYILVGLALTSTIIELVRRQYAQSWRRLQRLIVSGPLAETIRRLGEQAGGDMSAFHSDLRKVLTVISMPRLKWSASLNRGDAKDEDWEEAVEAVLRDIASNANNDQPKKNPIVQIVIYESSILPEEPLTRRTYALVEFKRAPLFVRCRLRASIDKTANAQEPTTQSSISRLNVGLTRSTKTIICRPAVTKYRSCSTARGRDRRRSSLFAVGPLGGIYDSRIGDNSDPMVQVMQNRTERPSAIVCIAYRQLSTMTGFKDPIEQRKVEKVEENIQMNVVAKKSLSDLTTIYMQDFFKFSKDMAESFRAMFDNLKVRIEQFHEQNRSIFDLFSLSHLQKWSQREP